MAIENRRLYESISQLFDGFVKASVTAIESRDPTTSGHSDRVADLTVGLAEVVDRCDTGPYRDLRFTAEELREMRYASLLHDFGKVGVREHVLVKAKKLYPADLELIRHRIELLMRDLELGTTRRKLDWIVRQGAEGYGPQAHADGRRAERRSGRAERRARPHPHHERAQRAAPGLRRPAPAASPPAPGTTTAAADAP